MRIGLIVVAVYLFLGIMPLLRWGTANHRWTPLGFHVVALTAAALFGLGDLSRRVQVVRDWLAFALVPFLYYDLRFIAGGIGLSKKDARIVALDRMVFRGDLWQTLALKYRSVAVSEALHFCYVSYYPLIAVPPILLYRKGKRHEFTVTVLTLVLAYVLCFSVSVLFPVDGPRFVNGPSSAPSGPFRGIALTLLQLFSSRGAAFPSSHVAASVAATYCALRFQRRVGYAALVATCGLAIGAVYGGLHYTTDIIAGGFVGGAAILVSRFLEQPAKAAVAAVAADDAPLNMQIMRHRLAQHARHTRPLRPSKEIHSDGEPTPQKDDN